MKKNDRCKVFGTSVYCQTANYSLKMKTSTLFIGASASVPVEATKEFRGQAALSLSRLIENILTFDL